MEEDIGIACGSCDTFSPMGVDRCPACGSDLALFDRPAQAPIATTSAEVAAPPQEEEMEQARYYVCKECSTPVPSGH